MKWLTLSPYMKYGVAAGSGVMAVILQLATIGLVNYTTMSGGFLGCGALFFAFFAGLLVEFTFFDREDK